MYLRSTRRIKDGKAHRYWSVVESRRCAGGRVVQKPLLYLGEINDSQHAAWCRVIEGFDEEKQRSRQLALFPAGQALPEHAKAYGVQVQLGTASAAAVGRVLAGLPALRAARAGSVLGRAAAGLARRHPLASLQRAPSRAS